MAPLMAAGEPLEGIRQEAVAGIETAEKAADLERGALAKKYAAALEGLEKKLAPAGDLDAVVRVREERAAVEESGETTAHDDPELVKLREIYRAAMDRIDDGLAAAKARAGKQISERVAEAETELTKAGKVDEALELRKAGGRLVLEITGGGAEVGFDEDPRAGGVTALNPIVLPDAKTPFFEQPFAIRGRWLEPMRVPAARQRIREAIVIGDRAKKAWPTVVVTKGSTWVGSGSGRVEVSAGNLIAEDCRFEALPFSADLGSAGYFTLSAFDDCLFEKGGVWYGGDQAGKFYFDRCLIKERFSGPLNVVDNGFRAEKSVFQDIELPPMWFRKKQPADYLNHEWLRLVNCRFVNCRIPASFLYLTRDCIFEDCTFVDDPSEAHPEQVDVETPFEIVLYVQNCKSRMSKVPGMVTITEKPVTELKGVVIPTAESLEREMSK